MEETKNASIPAVISPLPKQAGSHIGEAILRCATSSTKARSTSCHSPMGSRVLAYTRTQRGRSTALLQGCFQLLASPPSFPSSLVRGSEEPLELPFGLLLCSCWGRGARHRPPAEPLQISLSSIFQLIRNYKEEEEKAPQLNRPLCSLTHTKMATVLQCREMGEKKSSGEREPCRLTSPSPRPGSHRIRHQHPASGLGAEA